MGRVVQGEAHGEDEDDAGGDLNGQSHEVGAPSYLQQSQSNTEKHQNAHNEVGDQEKIDDGDGSKSKTYVSQKLCRYNLHKTHLEFNKDIISL